MLRESLQEAMTAKVKEDASIKDRIKDIDEAVKAIRKDLIAGLPKMHREGKVLLDDLQVEVMPVRAGVRWGTGGGVVLEVEVLQSSRPCREDGAAPTDVLCPMTIDEAIDISWGADRYRGVPRPTWKRPWSGSSTNSQPVASIGSPDKRHERFFERRFPPRSDRDARNRGELAAVAIATPRR